MGGVINVVQVLLITLAVLALASVAWVYLRRRWLSRTGGTFACSLRPQFAPVDRWVLGVARYREHQLQWYPAFSLSLWPSRRFDRDSVRAGEQRRPQPDEAGLLFDAQRIVALQAPSGEVELAMAADSMTGLLSWLEAGPPGMRYRLSPTSPE